MNNRKIISAIAAILAVLMVLTLFAGVIPTFASAVSQDDIDEIQKQKDSLASKSDSLMDKIATLKEQQETVLEQKAILDERVENTGKQIELTEEQIALYTDLVEEKQEEVDAAKEVEQKQLDRYRLRVRAMEENGKVDYLGLILQADSFSELLSIIDDIGEILESDKRLEDEYIAAREALEKVQAEYEEEKSKYEAKQQELEDEKKELEDQIDEANKLLTDLEKDIEKYQKEYEAAEKAEKAAAASLINLVNELNRQNAQIAADKAAAAAGAAGSQPSQGGDSTSEGGNTSGGTTSGETTPAETTPDAGTQGGTETPSGGETQTGGSGTSSGTDSGSGSGIVSAGSEGVSGSGTLMWPVPCSHTISSPYGARTNPITGEVNSFHYGMDIDGYGNDGNIIVACDGGVVVRSQYSSSYGNYVMIDHGNGVQTLYAHMSATAVSYGDTVTQGQVIGYLGSTGWSTGTHCHLEVYINGSRVDPASCF